MEDFSEIIAEDKGGGDEIFIPPANRVQAPAPVDYDPIQDQRRNLLVPDEIAPTTQLKAQPEQFNQLAEALGKVNPEINRFLSNTQDQTNAADLAAGKAQRIATAKSWGDAVKDGSADPTSSPAFINGWKEMDGQNAADSVRAQWQSDLQSDPIASSSDPKAIQQWVQGKVQSATQALGSDPAVLAGAMPRLQTYGSDLTDQLLGKANANAQYGLQSTLSTAVSNWIDTAYGDNKANGTPVDPTKLGTEINTITNLPKFVGMDGKVADQVVTQAVTTAAEKYRDPDLLDALTAPKQDVNNPSQTIPGFGSSGEGQAHILEAQERIHALIAQDNGAAHAAQEWAWAQQEHAGDDAAVKSLLASNGQINQQGIQAVSSAGGAKGLEKYFQLGQAWNSSQERAAPQEVATSYQGLYSSDHGSNTDGTPKTNLQWATDQVRTGNFTGNPTAVKDYLTEAHNMDETGILSYPMVRQLGAKIAGDTQAGFLKDLQDPLKAQAATNDFYNQMTSYAQSEKAAGRDPALTINQKAQSVMADVVNAYKDTGAGAAMPSAGQPTTAQNPQAETRDVGLKEEVSPHDLAILQKYRSVPAVTSGIKSQYTRNALRKAGFQ